jgi:3-oxoacyl-[acyl-carrier protein] reductase
VKHEKPFEGRVALVTGSSRGIGAATARTLARAGAAVAVNGRDAVAVDRLVAELAASGATVVAAPGDAADPNVLTTARGAAARRGRPGRPPRPVAGGGGAPRPLPEYTPAQWRLAMEQNLDPAFVALREFLPGMVERGVGAVVAVASTAGQTPTQAGPGYATAKAGLLMLIRHTAAQVASHGVRVNAVSPGTVINTSIAALPEPVRERMASAVPAGPARPGRGRGRGHHIPAQRRRVMDHRRDARGQRRTAHPVTEPARI